LSSVTFGTLTRSLTVRQIRLPQRVCCKEVKKSSTEEEKRQRKKSTAFADIIHIKGTL